MIRLVTNKLSRGALLGLPLLNLLDPSALASGADTTNIVVPNSLADRDAAFGSGTLANRAHRNQEVYGKSHFQSVTGAMVITELRFRPDYFYGGAFSTTISNIEINLSTTKRGPDALSPVYADNVGADNVMVLSGAVAVASQFVGPTNGPKAFDISIPLTRPFLYFPGAGNLLVDIRNYSGSAASLLSG